MNINDIEQIVKILSQSDVTDFELEQEGTRIHLVRGGSGRSTHQAGQGEIEPLVAVAPHIGAPQVQKGVTVPNHWVKVPSPIVGTFYRKPSPDSEAFVKEGDRVKRGQTLCIVEAMKLMNEIESPADGTVEKILLADGHVVEYGEVLFMINPS
jgi:acetyl-CoA carboxylase biotin carboxyl carrier protein